MVPRREVRPARRAPQIGDSPSPSAAEADAEAGLAGVELGHLFRQHRVAGLSEVPSDADPARLPSAAPSQLVPTAQVPAAAARRATGIPTVV